MSNDNSTEWSAVIAFLFIVLFGLGIFAGVAGTTQSFRKDAVLKGHAHWVVDVDGNTTLNGTNWFQAKKLQNVSRKQKLHSIQSIT
jgi:hypothetical protein